MFNSGVSIWGGCRLCVYLWGWGWGWGGGYINKNVNKNYKILLL